MTYIAARFYENVDQARNACDALKAKGFSSKSYAIITGITDEEGNTTGNLVEAVRAGNLLAEHADFYVKHLTEGLSLVVVQPPFGYLELAKEVLITNGALNIKHDDPYMSDRKRPLSGDPAPLSSFFSFKVLSDTPTPTFEKWGWRLLSDDRSSTSRSFPQLTSPNFALTGMFGLLSKGAAPLSGMMGMQTLSNDATPLSKMAGLPVLSNKLTLSL